MRIRLPPHRTRVNVVPKMRAHLRDLEAQDRPGAQARLVGGSRWGPPQTAWAMARRLGTLRGVVVRQLRASEVDVYRSIRLRALECDSAAFESSYEREASFDDATWRSRLASFAGRPGAVFVVDVDRRAEAMMGIGQGTIETQAVIWGMWVAPAIRRRGYGEQLLAAGLTWARDLGLESISLDVFPANTAAVALYRVAGFRPVVAGDAPADPGQTLTLLLSVDSLQSRDD